MRRPSEAFHTTEERLFLRTVEQYPARKWPAPVAFALQFLAAGAIWVVGLLLFVPVLALIDGLAR